MKIPLRWQQLLVAELVVCLICFFAVNLLVDFLDFSAHPAANTPTPYYPHVFDGTMPQEEVSVEKIWAEVLFFLLVFFGQIAIFRQRKFIFKTKQRTNG